ncbi:hypothetical protein Hanom_Chr02g00117981 [Helianthus anomalus]
MREKVASVFFLLSYDSETLNKSFNLSSFLFLPLLWLSFPSHANLTMDYFQI